MSKLGKGGRKEGEKGETNEEGKERRKKHYILERSLKEWEYINEYISLGIKEERKEERQE